MRAIFPLRAIAIVSNIAFIAYAVGASNTPILVLHMALLPLNVVRLIQHRRLLRQIRIAAEQEPNIEVLAPLMATTQWRAGETVFAKGDTADAIHVLLKGRVELPEVGATLEPGAIFGEISLFLADNRRMATAVCAENCEIGSISAARVIELMVIDPRFGLFLTRLIASRMDENLRRLSG